MDNNFKILNNLLDIFFDDFIKDNIDLLITANNQIENYYISTNYKSNNNYPYIDKDTILLYTIEVLNNIDKNLTDSLIQGLNNKKILIWEEKERQDIELLFKRELGNKYDDIINQPGYFARLTQYDNKITSSILNYPLTNTIKDIPLIIHEHMHYYSLDSNNKEYHLYPKYTYLSELISIYFETRACDYLFQKNYTNKDIYNILNSRYYDIFTYNAFEGLTFLLNLISKKISYKEITPQNIINNNDIEGLKRLKRHLGNLEQYSNIHLDNILFIKQLFKSINNPYEYCDILITKLQEDKKITSTSEYIDTNKYRELISYTLGGYFSTIKRNTKTDNRMLFVTNNLINPEYSNTELLSIINNPYPYKKILTK